MTFLEALSLGILQGITEFLPISSSGHLILAEHFLHVKGGGLAFDVFLHLGTLLAVILYFWTDWWNIISGSYSKKNLWARRLLIFLIIGTIPGALAGIFLEDYVKTTFREPIHVALMLALMSLPLLFAEVLPKHTKILKEIRLPHVIFIGLAQALAIIPGTSRSGITMSAGLFTGLTREEAARFSFLLSAPIIAGAGLFECLKLYQQGSPIGLAYLVGFLASLISGLLVINWLLHFLKKHTFYPFIIYRFLLALLIYALVKF